MAAQFEAPIASWLILLSHCIASMTLLFLHRALFWNVNVLFDSPLLITLIECVFTTIVCGWRLVKHGVNLKQYLKDSPVALFQELELKPYVSISFTFMILLNNLCLYNLDLPLYFVSRSVSTIFSLIFSLKKLKLPIIAGLSMSVFTISIGYIITLLEEYRINTLIPGGVICGILSSLCYTIYTSELSTVRNSHSIACLKVVFLNNLCSSCILFAIAIVYTGLGEFIYVPYYLSLDSVAFYFGLLIACLCALFIGTMVAFETQLFSTSSREFLGLVRAIPQTVLAVLIFQTAKTPMWWLGNLLTLIGCGAYWKCYRSHSYSSSQQHTTVV